MISLVSDFATLFCSYTLIVMSPGPNFFATLQTSISYSRKTGYFLVMGIAAGTLVWALISLLGLGLLLKTEPILYEAIKMLGGFYLVYLGIKSLSVMKLKDLTFSKTQSLSISKKKAFLRGLWVDLTNPKVTVFFNSLFALTVPTNSPFWYKFTVVCTVIMIVSAWYFLIVRASTSRSFSFMNGFFRKFIHYVAGLVFTILGIIVIFI